MRDVVAYVAVGVVAWALGTATWLLLAGVGQRAIRNLGVERRQQQRIAVRILRSPNRLDFLGVLGR